MPSFRIQVRQSETLSCDTKQWRYVGLENMSFVEIITFVFICWRAMTFGGVADNNGFIVALHHQLNLTCIAYGVIEVICNHSKPILLAPN